MELPSLELLSEVFGEEVIDVVIIANQCIYFTRYKNGNRKKHRINICELAYKCKKWALSHGYELSSGLLRKAPPYCFASTFLNDTKFEEDTEIEAIFTACEWIRKKLMKENA